MRRINKMNNLLWAWKDSSILAGSPSIQDFEWLIEEVYSLEAANEALHEINKNNRIMAWFGDPNKIPDGWVKIKKEDEQN